MEIVTFGTLAGTFQITPQLASVFLFGGIRQSVNLRTKQVQTKMFEFLDISIHKQPLSMKALG